LNVPFVGTIWDDPEGWLADECYDALSRQLFMRHFRKALRQARRVSTVSETMQEVYRQEYGLDSQLLRHGHDLEDGVSLPAVHGFQQAITVGFAGNFYGEDSWRAFLGACARINAQDGFCPIKIVVFGGKHFPYPHPGVEVDQQGWLPRREMLRRLATVDFCYLPYWFDDNKRRHAELSFPTKLTTYVAAGRPVLYHGPEYAGVNKIIQHYGLGVCVYSLKPDIVALTVKLLLTDRDLRREISHASLTAFVREFNTEVMLKNFANLLGLCRFPSITTTTGT
jgi:glycosyltransferase involved in cell wall biosynthesis